MHPPIAPEGNRQTGESPGAPLGVPIDFLSACSLPGLSLLVGRETGLRRAYCIGVDKREKKPAKRMSLFVFDGKGVLDKILQERRIIFEIHQRVTPDK